MYSGRGFQEIAKEVTKSAIKSTQEMKQRHCQRMTVNSQLTLYIYGRPNKSLTQHKQNKGNNKYKT